MKEMGYFIYLFIFFNPLPLAPVDLMEAWGGQSPAVSSASAGLERGTLSWYARLLATRPPPPHDDNDNDYNDTSWW